MSTYRTNSIVLNRRPFREKDVLVTLFSFDRGRLELIARGAKKPSSKIAGHIEPISLVEIMVIKGKTYDYLGTSIVSEAYLNIKKDLNLTIIAGKGIGVFNKIIDNPDKDQELFNLLYLYLHCLNTQKNVNINLFYNFFLLKLIINQGHKPILPQDISGNMFFDISRGQIFEVCREDKKVSAISEKCVRLLKYGIEQELTYLSNIKENINFVSEFSNIIGSLLDYYLKPIDKYII